MSDKAQFMPDEVYDYLLSVSHRDHDELASLREHTQQLRGAQMAIPPEQGQLLQFLIKLMGAKRILELGMFTGYSALAMALVLPEDGELVTCELDDTHLELAETHWQRAGVGEKVSVKIGPALASLEAMLAEEQGQFDFAFIDADKSNYDVYYELCLQLVRPGGLIAMDNTLWFGRLVQVDDGTEATAAMRALNQKVHQDERVDIITLPVGGGLTLARRVG